MTDTGIDTLQALFIAWGLRIGGACLILLIGHWLSKALSAIAVRVMERRKVDITLSKFLHNIIYYLVISIPFPQRDVHIRNAEHRSGSPITGHGAG
jgi:small-conductance mechanosensitive channel